MEITAIIVKSNGHAYLESLWSSPEKAQQELERLEADEDYGDDEFTLVTAEVQE